MGRPKVKIIDDSQPEEEVKTQPKKGPRKDELVEKLRAELGIQEEKKEAAGGSVIPSGSEESQDESKVTQPPKEKPEPGIRSRSLRPREHGKEKPRGKKYQEAAALVDPENKYSVSEAIELVKKVSYSSFEGTLEAHLNVNVKSLRGSVSLPYASGKKVRIVAFGKGAEDSGADTVGDDKKLEDIKAGKIDFDFLLTTPDWMGKIAPLAKVLGPKGLMPNPKNGTITDDLKKAVLELQSGKTEYKTEPSGKVIHLSLGKVSQPTAELSQNIKVLIQTIGKTKVSKMVLSPTMGPGVKLDLGSL